MADARPYFRNLIGRRLTVKPIEKAGEAGDAIPVRRSQIQMAYVNKVDWLAQLAQTASTLTSYQPNEPELSIEGLNSKVVQLQAFNQRVDEARVKWKNARMKRDKLVKGKDESVMTTSRAVKDYLGAIFGFNSPEYDQVKGINIG